MKIESLHEIFLCYPKVSTDTRKIEHGTLYFALKGAAFNGNDFALEALSKGAAYAIVDEDIVGANEAVIKVDNVLSCLQQLANYHRKFLGIPVLGITGTNGKTTTKELVASVLSKKYKIVFTQGNLNNHIGVPLTLLSLTPDTEFAVIEMGASRPGDIKELCEIAEPNFGLITNVGVAHLEGFRSFDGVKKTKAELYDFLKKKDGLVFINYENPHLIEMLNSYLNIYTYASSSASVTAHIIGADPFLRMSFKVGSSELNLQTQLSGAYNFENVLAAISIGSYFSIEAAAIKEAIESYKPENNRSQIIEKGSNTLFVDCYNANPSSMKASIENFSNLSLTKKLLILGDMFELGESSTQEHRNLLDQIVKLSLVGSTWLVGAEFAKVNSSFGLQHCNNADELIDHLKKQIISDTAILIKGSRGMRLEKILDAI